MENIKLALEKLEGVVIFIPDSEIQIAIEQVIQMLQQELYDISNEDN